MTRKHQQLSGQISVRQRENDSVAPSILRSDRQKDRGKTLWLEKAGSSG